MCLRERKRTEERDLKNQKVTAEWLVWSFSGMSLVVQGVGKQGRWVNACSP